MSIFFNASQARTSLDWIDTSALTKNERLQKGPQDLWKRHCQQHPHWQANPMNSRQVRMLASVGFESQEAIAKEILGILFQG